MSERAIDRRWILGCRPSRRGGALLTSVVVVGCLLGLVLVAGTASVVEVKDSRKSVDDVGAQYLADAGLERGANLLAQAVKETDFHDPLQGLGALFQTSTSVMPFVEIPVMDGNSKVGAYSVKLTRIAQTSSSITIAIDSTGYRPDAPSALPANGRLAAWRAERKVVTYELAPSQVFDFAYFINNWGWFYGDSIICNGNARSNGQFDAANYAPTVTGQPMYDSVSWDGSHAALAGYHDDNQNGLMNGDDGGVFSGWNIINAQNIQGNGGQAGNQHSYQPQISMPNLSDLSRYEANAIQQGGSITIGGVTVSDAVYGDASGERGNLYLVGTAANPIVIHGPVVVRGDVIISGYVTGQGAIYSGGNVYCPDSVKYANPPTSPRPASNAQSDTEAWLSANWNKDALGLFARENVVIGDITDGTWQYYVSSWMADPMNTSKEDAGTDGIPNTHAGRDGIPNTADDDVLENDGLWTVEHYTAQDAVLGLIPPGKQVGDAIPGTGEDIDGDGVFDPQTTLSNVMLSRPLDSANWGGNMPASGIASYHDIASMTANRMDAIFYTNHTFCWVVLGGTDAQINGSVVSRNEDIIYGTPNVRFNYDCRMLGGASSVFGRFLPTVLKKISVIFYLKNLCPVEIPIPPPFNVMVIDADPTPFWIAVPGLLVLSLILLAYSGLSARNTEISYGE